MQESGGSSYCPSVQDRLLDAAEQVVLRDGISNLTLESVAKEAGVSKGGLLYHYPSKSVLITAIVNRLGNRCQLKQEEALASDSNSPGAFTRAYLHARTRTLKPHERPLQTALLAAAGTDPHYLDEIRERVAEWDCRLHGDGIDPTLAMIVRLAIDGLCLCDMIGIPTPQGEERQKVLDQLLQMSHQRKDP
jgi:AcrR family transcriptional regulator